MNSLEKYLRLIGLIRDEDKLVWIKDECYVQNGKSSYKIDDRDVAQSRDFKMTIEEFYNTTDIEITPMHTLSYFMGVYSVNGIEVDESKTVFEVLEQFNGVQND